VTVADERVVSGRLLTFRVGAGRFAVPLASVLGVQDPAQGGAPSGGDVRFQGRRVAAIDTRSLWGAADTTPVGAAKNPAVIVVSGADAPVALLVDGVEGIVEGVEMRPLPALVAPFVKDAFRGVALHADGGRLVVNPAALAATAVGGQRGPGEA
jgi:chemotaxis signal transduction protein